jgi:hypothetical protein
LLRSSSTHAWLPGADAAPLTVSFAEHGEHAPQLAAHWLFASQPDGFALRSHVSPTSMWPLPQPTVGVAVGVRVGVDDGVALRVRVVVGVPVGAVDVTVGVGPGVKVAVRVVVTVGVGDNVAVRVADKVGVGVGERVGVGVCVAVIDVHGTPTNCSCTVYGPVSSPPLSVTRIV